MTDRLLTYPEWPELDDLAAAGECAVPAEARPGADIG